MKSQPPFYISNFVEPYKMDIIQKKIKSTEYRAFKKRIKSIEAQKKSKFLDNNLNPICIQKANHKMAIIKENQMNLENKVLMKKLQKIFLPDPKTKIDVSINEQENFIKKRNETLKKFVRNKQINIAIENERIRKRIIDKKSVYNFSSTVFNKGRGKSRLLNSSFHDTIDYSNCNQLSKSFNNDVIFNSQLDDSGVILDTSTNQEKNSSSCDTNEMNETRNKLSQRPDTNSDSRLHNKSQMMESRYSHKKNMNVYKLPSKANVMESYRLKTTGSNYPYNNAGSRKSNSPTRNNNNNYNDRIDIKKISKEKPLFFYDKKAYTKQYNPLDNSNKLPSLGKGNRSPEFNVDKRNNELNKTHGDN